MSGDQCVLSAAGASFGGQDEDVGGRQGRADEGQVLGSGMTVILILMLWVRGGRSARSPVAGRHAGALVDVEYVEYHGLTEHCGTVE